jgi:AcrR family transcriptional regulator
MDTVPTSAPKRPRAARSDGLRNRRQVLEAAADAFAADGLGASVNDIAREASVGIGTLYRHFPTKERLLAEVVKGRLIALVQATRELTTTDQSDPAAPLLDWIKATSGHVGLFTAVSPWVNQALAEDPELHALHEEIKNGGDRLLRTAQHAGRADPTASIEDVTAAIVALSARPSNDPERPRRLLALFTHGLLRHGGA